jgi:hypothetical protein
MRQEARDRDPLERIYFPDEPVVGREPYEGRFWPPSYLPVEPNYVCHGRLLFRQINAERYGWDAGWFHPFISAAAFFADVVTLPYHVATAPCRYYECSAGLCLPGDPVPLAIYPPEWSATGTLYQAAIVVALLAIFP